MCNHRSSYKNNLEKHIKNVHSSAKNANASSTIMQQQPQQPHTVGDFTCFWLLCRSKFYLILQKGARKTTEKPFYFAKYLLRNLQLVFDCHFQMIYYASDDPYNSSGCQPVSLIFWDQGYVLSSKYCACEAWGFFEP